MSGATMEDSGEIMIDADYEFLAPKFFDFIEGETEEQMHKAEIWFDTALSYAPSPCMPKIKATRTVQLENLCDFGEAEKLQKEPGPSESTISINTMENINSELEKQSEKAEHNPADIKEDVASKEATHEHSIGLPDKVCVAENTGEVRNGISPPENRSGGASSSKVIVEQFKNKKAYPVQGEEACTPKPMTSQKLLQTESKKKQTARKIASPLKNPSEVKPKCPRSIRPVVRRDTSLTNKAGTPNFAQENQAIKKQKLEGGKTRQILNIKPQNLPHKARPGVVNGSSNLATPSTAISRKGERKMYVREPVSAPFVSMAEMVRKFQSGTRDMNLPPRISSLSHSEAGTVMQRKPKLTLTRPKEPEFETSQRVRSVKIKSSAEIEEEMMSKIPKFKARPVNRKIFEAPTLPAMKRSTPQVPEFHEFHLETMVRANQNAETSTIASTETVPQNHQWKPNHLTTPKIPILHTSLRARPPTIKCSQELEIEELEKAPKFKARPLNKKIFESKGELGLFCNTKRQVTVPQEFHFAINDRIPPTTANVNDLFDKLSLCSESHNEKPILRKTAANPFHLRTEERGAYKEKNFLMEVIHKQIEEERARIRKANPYPYTTDFPVVPPKPEPKQCTKAEPFQLESLLRHEEEIQREMEERRRLEEEEARMRIFKAQPILKEDPIPVPEKVRKPLTEVQGFDLQVEHRAVDRDEFNKKLKEKEMMYKRYRDEAESAKMMEEEKALKQLRRTLIPHARPVPNFSRPFLPQKNSKGATKPKSPRLKIIERKERRKTVVTAANSSAASSMR